MIGKALEEMQAYMQAKIESADEHLSMVSSSKPDREAEVEATNATLAQKEAVATRMKEAHDGALEAKNNKEKELNDATTEKQNADAAIEQVIAKRDKLKRINAEAYIPLKEGQVENESHR